MVDLSKIRVAFFDFDDTMCIHLDHGYWKDWFRDCVVGDGLIYLDKKKCMPMPFMGSLIADCIREDITRICLTWGNTDMSREGKLNFINHYYGNNAIDKIYYAGQRSEKARFVQKYCTELGIDPSEVLVVEDHPHTIEEMLDIGCNIMTPQEVVVIYSYADSR